MCYGELIRDEWSPSSRVSPTESTLKEQPRDRLAQLIRPGGCLDLTHGSRTEPFSVGCVSGPINMLPYEYHRDLALALVFL